MNSVSFCWQSKRLFIMVILLCLQLSTYSQVPTAHAQASFQNITEKLFDNGIWWIEKRDDPSVPVVQSPMTIFVNGVNRGETRQLSFGHKKEGQTSWPEIAAIYNTGYIRLVPFDLPWGTSFILGPAYWEKVGSSTRYFHNIQISRIDIDTAGVTGGSGALQLTIYARDYLEGYWPNYHLDIVYSITLPDPHPTSSRMQVRATYTVASAFSLSLNDQTKHQGFKWVQFSSMYIDQNFHDSDSVRYQTQSGNVTTSSFTNIGCNQYIISTPQALSASSSWVEVRHSDNLGWQGNTPNTAVIVNNPNTAEPIVPQGTIALSRNLTCKTDPNDDNVGVWINREAAPQAFNPGDTGNIDYTLIAQDDPLTLAQLSVSKTGSGNGIITSNPGGINCGSDCSEPYLYNTNVALTPIPSAGSVFVSWSGDCSGAGGCNVSMSAPRTVTARFEPANWFLSTRGDSYFGNDSDLPVPADYNGDGVDDVAVYRPSSGMWYISTLGDFRFGEAGDVLVPADYNADRREDVAVYRPSNGMWYISTLGNFHFGENGDIPVPGDYNGDGWDDIAVYRPSTGVWYISSRGNFTYGQPGDIPVPADYNGDGRDDIAVYRPSNGTWYISTRGNFVYGQNGDMPLPGDYNGDGWADMAVFRPSNGMWYISSRGNFHFGEAGDIPIPGDYNGDHLDDIAVFRP